jgi:hypothetical protein
VVILLFLGLRRLEEALVGLLQLDQVIQAVLVAALVVVLGAAALPAKALLVVLPVKTMAYLALVLAAVVVLAKQAHLFLTTQEVVRVEMA